eukprot:c13194_g1_i3.p1 GENE.c13194_g1_i3~~c13194_g1_i3.p1  ORF type:complete len:609 (+),score=58.06 c13194_g1_i3:37-1827(+)
MEDKHGVPAVSLTAWGVETLTSFANTAKDVFQSALDRVAFARPDETVLERRSSLADRSHRRQNSFSKKLVIPENEVVPHLDALVVPSSVDNSLQPTSSLASTNRSRGALGTVRTQQIAGALPLALKVEAEFDEVECDKAESIAVTLSVLAPSAYNLIDEEWKRAPISLLVLMHWSTPHPGGIIAVASVLKAIVVELEPQDQVCILTPGETPESASVLAMTEEGKQQLLSILSNLSLADFPSADVWQFLQVGLDTLPRFAAHVQGNCVVQIALISHSNDVSTESPECIEMLSVLPPECSLSTFGFALDHDHTSLLRMARAGRGLYHHIADETAVPWCLGDCIGSSLSALGQGTRVRALALAGCTIESVHTEFPDLTQETSSFEVAIGHVSLEESRSVLLTLLLPERSKDLPAGEEVLEVSLGYTDAKTGRHFTVSETLTILRPKVRSDKGFMGLFRGIGIDRERMRSATVAQLGAARALADAGDFGGALGVLEKLNSLLKQSRAARDPIILTILVDLEATKLSVSCEEIYQRFGQKALWAVCERHAAQRPAGCAGDAFGCPWRELPSFENLYMRCPTAQTSYRDIASTARSWKFKNL